MRKYKEVYSWNVLDEIEAGKTVYMLDKECSVTIAINSMTVWTALKWIAAAKKDHDRFYFWYVEEVEEQEDEGNA